jgi:hypothetical protein
MSVRLESTCFCTFISLFTPAGTGIELEVLFDAALNGGRLDWKDVIPCIDGQGPLLLVARTDKGYAVLLRLPIEDDVEQQRVWRVPRTAIRTQCRVAQRRSNFLVSADDWRCVLSAHVRGQARISLSCEEPPRQVYSTDRLFLVVV